MTEKKKHPGGRPSKYYPEIGQELVEFFSIEPHKVDAMGKMVANPLPTFERFAANHGVHVDTMIEWTKQHPEFSEAYKNAKQLQKDIIIRNGIAGLYNPAFAIFTAKNITDMRDKQEQEIYGKDGSPLFEKVEVE